MKISKTAKTIAFVIAVSLSVFVISTTVLGSWSPPPTSPPTCVPGEPGCDAPLNVGPISQVKVGALGIGGVFQANSSAYLAVNSGNVGIGTANPQAKLDIVGGEIRVASSGAACDASRAGAIRFSNGVFYGCNGTSWVTQTMPLPPITVTVSKTGTGSGTVTSLPAGIDCGLTCSHRFTEGYWMRLTATVGIDSIFSNWAGSCTGSNNICTLYLTQDRSVSAKFEYGKFVFVTSAKYKGNLGGLSGADAKCNQLAGAAGLPGTYVAWLSTSTVDAKDRIFDGPYYNVARQKIANDIADLTKGSIGAAVLYSETGTQILDSVHTGTLSNGKVAGTYTCEDWTTDSAGVTGFARQGLSYFATSRWTDYDETNYGCGNLRPIYCFGI